jgi:hypothetical protein
VETVEQADLVLYNTCSIRDKAEQKVFNRLSDYKKYRSHDQRFSRIHDESCRMQHGKRCPRHGVFLMGDSECRIEVRLALALGVLGCFSSRV